MAHISFGDYYSIIFGEKKWAELTDLLRLPQHKLARYVAHPPMAPYMDGSRSLTFNSNIWGEIFQETTDLPEALALAREKNEVYLMDPASLFAPLALQVEPGERVLDLCAAPGGKALVMAQQLNGQGELWVNEISAPRRERLKRVLETGLAHHPGQAGLKIEFKSKDAKSWCLDPYFADFFDRILLDAPCSSEAHVLKSPKHFEQWGPKRSKILAGNQLTMISSSAHVLKVGGRMVYSTCALSPLENDGVIEAMLNNQAKRQGKGKTGPVLEVVDCSTLGLPYGEATQFGHQFLPTEGLRIGPIYLCVLKRIG